MTTQDVLNFMVLDVYGNEKPLEKQWLPFYSSVGSYPIVYLTDDGNVLCADCATAELRLWQNYESTNPPSDYGILWEGAPLSCDECSREIESAYGDPEEN